MPELKRLVAELGLGEVVGFSDPVAAEHIVDFVERADIGIIPYRVDGFAELVLPTKAYELAWMRIPIIAAETAGIRSMFRPESITLCAPGDPESFAEAFIALARDPERRASLVASAAEDYVPYEWEGMSARYRELLDTLSRGSRSPSVGTHTEARAVGAAVE